MILKKGNLLLLFTVATLSLYASEGSVAGFATNDIDSLSQDRAYGIALQSSGDVVLGTAVEDAASGIRMALVRYDSNVVRDAAFGTAPGLFLQDHPGTDNTPHAVAVLHDDTIVSVGGAEDTKDGDYDFLIQRASMDANAPTPSFNRVENFYGHHDVATDVAVDHDGNIVVVGNVQNAQGDLDIGVVRYEPLYDETLSFGSDVSFNIDGKDVQVIGTHNDMAAAVKIDDANRVVILGDTI